MTFGLGSFTQQSRKFTRPCPFPTSDDESCTPVIKTEFEYWTDEAEHDVVVLGSSIKSVKSKLRKRFSMISIRTTVEEPERKRKDRWSVGVTQQPTTRPTTRRTLACLRGTFQRCSVKAPPVTSISAPTLSIPRRHQSHGTLSGFIRLHPPPEPEWDFVCRGESPIVPPRDSSDEPTLLGNDQIGWVTIGCASLAFSEYDFGHKKSGARRRVPSPSSPFIRTKSVGSPRISFGSISHPIPISSLSGPQTYGTTSSTRFASCKQDSE